MCAGSKGKRQGSRRGAALLALDPSLASSPVPVLRQAHPKKQKGVFERSAARYKFVLIAPPSPPPSASTPWAPPSPTRFNWPGSPGSTLSSSPPLAPRPPQPPVALPPALIVEPRLREAFEAAIILDNATGVSAQDELTTYAALVRALPAVFVGDAEQLRALVEWMAARMGAAFAAAGRELPPWRSASALLARWRLDLDEA